ATGSPGRKFFDQLVRVDFRDPAAVDLWPAPKGCYLAGEPAFVPDPDHPDAGSLLVPLFDATHGETGATSFLLFDAFDLASGPRAVLPLASPIHLAFHSIFAPG